MVRKKSTSRKNVPTKQTTPRSKTPSRTNEQADNPSRSSDRGDPAVTRSSHRGDSTVNRSSHREDSTVNRSHRPNRTKNILIGTKTYKINVRTLQSIKLLQQSTAHCIPKLPFSRIVREVLQEFAMSRDMRIQLTAMQSLQEAAEIYLTTLFEDANLAAYHAKRITVRPVDMHFVERLRKNTPAALS